MDDPKQVIRKFVDELWNERRLDVADAIFAQDCVTPSGDSIINGKSGSRR